MNSCQKTALCQCGLLTVGLLIAHWKPFFIPLLSTRRRQWRPTPVLLPGKSHGRRLQTGRLQSMGSLRVGHDWATSLSLFTFMHWRRKWQPTPVFLPGECQGRGSLVGCRHGVAQSRTRLKRLSSSSSSSRKLNTNYSSLFTTSLQSWSEYRVLTSRM